MIMTKIIISIASILFICIGVFAGYYGYTIALSTFCSISIIISIVWTIIIYLSIVIIRNVNKIKSDPISFQI